MERSMHSTDPVRTAKTVETDMRHAWAEGFLRGVGRGRRLAARALRQRGVPDSLIMDLTGLRPAELAFLDLPPRQDGTGPEKEKTCPDGQVFHAHSWD